MANLKKKYQENIIPKLMQEFKFKNVNQVPRLTKVCINVGIGRVKEDKKFTNTVLEDIAKITGQKPVITQAKKAIAGFKVRQGMNVGVAVTLRGKKMYDFIERLINIDLPRIRDFKGLNPKSFDGRGNFGLGITEHIIFPEIKYENVEKIYSLEVNIASSAKNNKEAIALFRELGFPFKNILKG